MMRRIALCIFMVAAVATYSYFGYINSPAAVLNITNKPIDGTDRKPAIMSQWLTDIENSVNNVESAQIANGTIVNVDINASAAIVDSKFSCTSKWATLSDCDAAIANADAMHIHDASAITFSTSTFTATLLEDAIVELATAVGYSAAASAAATTTAAMYYMGVAIDDTNVWPTAVPAATVTVSTGTADFGVIVDLTSEIALNSPPGSPCIAAVPIAINNVNLSTALTHVPRYTVMSGAGDGADTYFYATSRIVYRTSDGWNPSVVNLVSVGTPYLRTGSTCTTNQTSNYILTVTALK